MEIEANVCRLCATNTTNSINVFANREKSALSSIGEMMLDCLFTEITPNSGYPESVCNYCNLQLTIFYEFKKKVLNNHVRFTEQLNTIKLIKQENETPISQQKERKPESTIHLVDTIILNKPEKDAIDAKNVRIIKTKRFTEEIESSKNEANELLNSTNETVSDIKAEQPTHENGDIYLDEFYLDEEFLDNDLSAEEYIDEEFILDTNETEMLDSDSELKSTMLQIEQGKKLKKRKPRTKPIGEERICIYCSEKFFNKSCYHKHMRSHGIKSTCDVCQRPIYEYLFEEHRQQHNNEYHCSICGKKFFNQLSCISHERRHSDVRPISCEKCDKTFKAACDLYNHMLCHNDIRKHVCTVCGKAYRMRSHLTVHMESHSENTKWQCSFCDTILKTSITLREHIKQLHSFDHSYKCLYCSKGFSNKSKWRRHVECVHAGESLKETEVEYLEMDEDM